MVTREKEEFLVTVNSEIEATIVQDILKQKGIPSLKKHKGMGEYLTIVTGMSSLGIDIYVPSSQLKPSKEIIEGIPFLGDQEE